MSENSSGRKKTFIVGLLAFLICGGAVFLFFIIQGAEDLKKSPGADFSYGNVVRGGVSSFFKSLGRLSLEDPELAFKKKAAELKFQTYADSSAGLDVSDWMAKPEGQAPKGAASKPGGPAASVRSPSHIPKMGGGSAGLGGGGGGGSKTGGSAGSNFSSGGDKGALRTSGNQGLGRGGAGAGKGTLGALRGASAALGEGLRSGSAVTAKTKWEQSFSGSAGGGTARFGGGGGAVQGASYGKAGLVALDKIESGDISDLKVTGSQPLAVGGVKAVPDPTKSMEQQMTDMLASRAASGLANGMNPTGGTAGAPPAGGGTGPEAKNMPNTPPPDVANAMNNHYMYCKDPCAGPYKDEPPQYKQAPDGSWTATVHSTAFNPDGTVQYVADWSLNITGTPPQVSVNHADSNLTYPNGNPWENGGSGLGGFNLGNFGSGLSLGGSGGNP